MKYENRDTFEAVNMFGTGVANTAFSRYFIGDSFLNPVRAGIRKKVRLPSACTRAAL